MYSFVLIQFTSPQSVSTSYGTSVIGAVERLLKRIAINSPSGDNSIKGRRDFRSWSVQHSVRLLDHTCCHGCRSVGSSRFRSEGVVFLLFGFAYSLCLWNNFNLCYLSCHSTISRKAMDGNRALSIINFGIDYGVFDRVLRR